MASDSNAGVLSGEVSEEVALEGNTVLWITPHPEKDHRVLLKLLDWHDLDYKHPLAHPRRTMYSQVLRELPTYQRDTFPNPRAGEPRQPWSLEKLHLAKKVDVLRVAKSIFDKFNVSEYVAWHPDIVKWIREDEKRRLEVAGILLREGGTELPYLMEHNRKLWRALAVGPIGKYKSIRERNQLFRDGNLSFQTTDVAFLAACPNPLNGNQPGVGKTIEAIAAVEEGRTPGPWLVVCPMTAINRVWAEELNHWQPHDYYLAVGTPAQRGQVLAEVKERFLTGDTNFWLVCNPEMIRYKGIYSSDNWSGERKLVDVEARWSAFYEIEWGCIILDEFHRMGMGNTATLTSRAFKDMKAGKKMAISGTPMGGKPIKLFGILRWLEPGIFTSKHEFGTSYLHVESRGNAHDNHATAVYGDLRPDREDAMNDMLSRYMVRHLKKEVTPWLPDKMYVHHDCDMTPEQAKQYGTFRDEAEIVIEEFSLGAIGILAEYTRLKQFADCRQKIEKVGVKVDELTGMTKDELRLTALPESGKLKTLEGILIELGLTKDTPYHRREDQVVVFTQFTSVAEMLHSWLRTDMGMRTGFITGGVRLEDRDAAQQLFQDRHLDVIVMNTKAGGVAINLPSADTVVFFDETWDPDDQEQAEDRCHRASKTSQVTVHYLRSVGTLEQYIWKTTKKKTKSNWNVLDARRMGFKA